MKIHYKWPFSIAMLVYQRVVRLIEASLLLACKLQGSDRRCVLGCVAARHTYWPIGSYWLMIGDHKSLRYSIDWVSSWEYLLITHDIPWLGSPSFRKRKQNTPFVWCPFTLMVIGIVIRGAAFFKFLVRAGQTFIFYWFRILMLVK